MINLIKKIDSKKTKKKVIKKHMIKVQSNMKRVQSRRWGKVFIWSKD